jgi:PPOX class probable F420-dependent enzyme
MPDQRSATGGGGQQEAADGYFGPLGSATYLLLTTFNPAGIPVSAHVHGMVAGGRAFFRAWDQSGTAMCLRHTDDVRVAPGRRPGLAVGPLLDAVARPLPGEEAGLVAQELARKYPLQQRFLIPLLRWLRRGQLAYYELLTYEAAASRDVAQEASLVAGRHARPGP